MHRCYYKYFLPDVLGQKAADLMLLQPCETSLVLSSDPFDSHDDRDDDGEGESVEEHKSVIMHLLSQVRLGMDLTKVKTHNQQALLLVMDSSLSRPHFCLLFPHCSGLLSFHSPQVRLFSDCFVLSNPHRSSLTDFVLHYTS